MYTSSGLDILEFRYLLLEWDILFNCLYHQESDRRFVNCVLISYFMCILHIFKAKYLLIFTTINYNVLVCLCAVTFLVFFSLFILHVQISTVLIIQGTSLCVEFVISCIVASINWQKNRTDFWGWEIWKNTIGYF